MLPLQLMASSHLCSLLSLSLLIYKYNPAALSFVVRLSFSRKRRNKCVESCQLQEMDIARRTSKYHPLNDVMSSYSLINGVNQSLLRTLFLAPGRKCNAARDVGITIPLYPARVPYSCDSTFVSLV